MLAAAASTASSYVKASLDCASAFPLACAGSGRLLSEATVCASHLTQAGNLALSMDAAPQKIGVLTRAQWLLQGAADFIHTSGCWRLYSQELTAILFS